MLILSAFMSFISYIFLSILQTYSILVVPGRKWLLELDTFELPQPVEGKDSNASTVQLIGTRIGIVVW